MKNIVAYTLQDHHLVKVSSRIFVKTCKCFSYQCYMEYFVFVLIFARCVKIIKKNDKKKPKTKTHYLCEGGI